MTNQVVKLKPINKQLIEVTISGLSPYISHAWSEKALKMIRDKHAGRKSKDREVRNPEEEMRAVAYYTEDGEYGIPAMAIKSAIVGAAHKDLGIEKTLVRKGLFLRCTDTNGVLPMRYSDVVMREDMVRVGRGSTDLRYRPEFRDWSVDLVMQIDTELLTVSDVVNLLNRAGFGIGVGEWRPEKNGEFGRFEVSDTEQPAAAAA